VRIRSPRRFLLRYALLKELKTLVIGESKSHKRIERQPSTRPHIESMNLLEMTDSRYAPNFQLRAKNLDLACVRAAKPWKTFAERFSRPKPKLR